MLDILDLILGLLEVDDLDGDDLLGPIVEAFVDLSEGSLPDSLLLREDQLRTTEEKLKKLRADAKAARAHATALGVSPPAMSKAAPRLKPPPPKTGSASR